MGSSSSVSRTLRKIILSSSDRTYNLRNRTVFSGKSNNTCVKVQSVSGPGDDIPSVDPTFRGGVLRLKQSGKKGVDKMLSMQKHKLYRELNDIKGAIGELNSILNVL